MLGPMVEPNHVSTPLAKDEFLLLHQLRLVRLLLTALWILNLLLDSDAIAVLGPDFRTMK